MSVFKNNYLPPEWDNEERMRVLMGPMPQITDSTVAYKSRLLFWTANLHQWLKVKEGLTFSLQEAQLAFKRGTQTVQCFTEVLNHLISKGEILTFNEFQCKGKESESWSSWGKRCLISTPTKWAWRKVQDTIGATQSLDSTVFIDWTVVQEFSDKILSFYWNDGSAVEEPLTVQEFFQISKKAIDHLILDDMNIIIQFLSINNKATIKVHQEETYMKLVKPGRLNQVAITQSEIAQHQLKVTEAKLQLRMSSLQQEIDPLRDQAKLLLQNGSKKQALTLLRRKKQLELSYDRTSLSYENVSSCLRQLIDSEMNKDILGSFKCGLSALKSSIEQTGSFEEVSKTMDSLQDMIEDCNEITEALSLDVHSKNIDDAMLEKELEDLMRPSSNLKSDIDLPSVPVDDPLTSNDNEDNRIIEPNKHVNDVVFS